MTYSNFDVRVKGKFHLPAERVRFLRRLEREVREARQKKGTKQG